jgi:hypothetical protein
MKDRKPTSIDVVRQGSHVSELSLPVLYHPRLRSGRNNFGSSRQGSSLANGSAKAVREILTQVEEDLSRGAPRRDILEQLRALSETLDREMRDGDQRELDFKPGREVDGAPAPDEADRGGNAIDYEKKLLELREKSLALDGRSRSNSGDLSESYESGDESSGTSNDGGEGDDLSEFTKWLEEIEKEEGGIAQDSMNFLLGLFNFQSLMLVKQEESEPETSSQSSQDSDAQQHRAASFKAVSTTGSNFWSSLQPQPNDKHSHGRRPKKANDAGRPPVDDGKDDTLSLSSIESNQYSKHSQERRPSNKVKVSSRARSSKPSASSNIAMYPHPGDSRGKAGGAGEVDYDLMWDSSRRRRSRSFRGAFRSRSSGRKMG